MTTEEIKEFIYKKLDLEESKNKENKARIDEKV